MGEVRVATWNVHGAVGLDRRCDPARIARVIGELDADVVALQEVWAARGRTADLCALLEDAAGARCVFVPTFDKRGQPFGNALLTRLPLLHDAVLDLAVGRREPRNAIDAVVDAGGSPLRFIATHLGLGSTERRVQFERLARGLRAQPTPCVVLGDFNVWRGQALFPALRELDRLRSPATFPSALPVVALDRVLAHAPLRVRERRVHASRAARIASDHRPLLATIDVGEAPAAGRGAADAQPPSRASTR